MPQRLTNLLLLVVVAGLVASGLLGWVLPEPGTLPLYDLHRLLGVALLVLLLPKWPISRASLRRRLSNTGRFRSRRDHSVLFGLAGACCLAVSVGLGLAWTLGLVSYSAFAGYSPLNLHVYFGLALAIPLLGHAVRRWEHRPGLGRLLTRRAALRLALGSAATLLGWQAIQRLGERAAVAAGAPAGGESARAGAPAAGSVESSGPSLDARRPSGSKHAGSFSGNAYPTTIWLLDSVPDLSAETWRLTLSGRVARPGAVTYRDLGGLQRRETHAVLDCTGGWWSEQIWSGVAVGDLLGAYGVDPAARLASVVSVTGHGFTFALDELGGAILATHVGGEVLTPGHGYPVRLVLPGRRGFQWVKWVDRIEVV